MFGNLFCLVIQVYGSSVRPIKLQSFTKFTINISVYNFINDTSV